MYLKIQGALQLVELAMAYCVVTRDERLVDERGFEPPASSLRIQNAKLDGAKTDASL